MSDAKRMARDIANQIDRHQRRRKLILVALLIAAIIAAVLYFGWGRGWGFGKGEGDGAGQGPGSALAATDAGPRRCAIRVTAEGIAVDGTIATQAEAVTACKAVGAADVIVTGDARQGLWDELKAALEAANIAVFQRGGAPVIAPDAGSAAPGSAAAPATPDGG